MTRSPGTLLAGLATLLLCAPAGSLAASGGTSPSAPAPAPPASDTRESGGTAVGDAPPKRRARKRTAPRPLLERFEVSRSRLYDLGPAARVTFRIRGRASTVHVKLHVRRAGERAALHTIDLGPRPTGEDQTARLTGAPAMPEGALELRISARDPRGRGLRRGARTSGVDAIEFRRHRFPLTGAFTFGSDGSRFGAPRSGHTHQGQDLAAAEGTPIVAPRGGTVTWVGYQAAAAGNYVVLSAAGEDRDYVFMHLQTGSTAVKQGERVRTGGLLGRVGSTGASTGPHLHFEIWVGEWHDGGHPIDPLPHLRRWDSWS
jgi:murein DD-endopeptidase MepM/ murein hydrolase activator NlpD